MVLDDSTIAVNWSLSRQLGIYRIKGLGTVNEWSVKGLFKKTESELLTEEVLAGKKIFHNATDLRMGTDGYMSCATCHLEGGSDRRVWDFTDRGEGFRRTLSLKARSGMQHGPLHWSANFDEVQDFEHDIRGPQNGLGFLTVSEEEFKNQESPLGPKKSGRNPGLDALAAYLVSLDSVSPSPYRNPDGSFTKAAIRGQKVFLRDDVGCVKCHTPPTFTDSKMPKPNETFSFPSVPGNATHHLTPQEFLVHDVGTITPKSGTRLNAELNGLDTPTLLGLWNGGPYLHDGSASNLRSVINEKNPNDQHGKTSHLSENEKDDLIAYLLQIDGNGEHAAIPNVNLKTHHTQSLLEPPPYSRELAAYVIPFKNETYAVQCQGANSLQDTVLKTNRVTYCEFQSRSVFPLRDICLFSCTMLPNHILVLACSLKIFCLKPKSMSTGSANIGGVPPSLTAFTLEAIMLLYSFRMFM